MCHFVFIFTMKDKVTAPRSFRVPITIPLEKKVRAVANYKKRMQTKELAQSFGNKSSSSSSSLSDSSTKPYMTLMENTPEYEDGQAKLEQLYLKGQELRAELHSLNSVRSSLLWLLKKSNTLELQRNHTNPHVPPFE